MPEAPGAGPARSVPAQCTPSPAIDHGRTPGTRSACLRRHASETAYQPVPSDKSIVGSQFRSSSITTSLHPPAKHWPIKTRQSSTSAAELIGNKANFSKAVMRIQSTYPAVRDADNARHRRSTSASKLSVWALSTCKFRFAVSLWWQLEELFLLARPTQPLIPQWSMCAVGVKLENRAGIDDLLAPYVSPHHHYV